MEEWKNIDIEEIYGYQVSNKGRIKALAKNVKYSDGRLRYYEEKILKNSIDTKGYYFIRLYTINNKILQLRVHRLVCQAFLENPENKPCVNHKDGNRLNADLENLEWCTISENNKDAFERGRIPSNIKLTKEQVLDIREKYNNKNLNQYEIAKIYNIGQPQVSRIINKKHWTKN